MLPSDAVLDLFAGPGGWDLAARALGLDPLGVEWDDAACATRLAAGLRTLQADVAALRPADFAPVSLLIASPPCQAFSMAGLGLGRAAMKWLTIAMQDLAATGCVDRVALDEACGDPRAHLVLEPLRWARELRPRLIACEQVEPVLPLWEAMAAALRRIGYSTWTGTLSAEQYGVPQTRGRAFLMARLDGPVAPPAPTHARYVPGRRGVAQELGLFEEPEPERIVLPEDRGLLPWVSMGDALGWDPDDLAGFPRRNDLENGGEYRERDLRAASEPAFALTEKARSWQRWPHERPATTVQGDPRVWPPGHKVNADDVAAGRDGYGDRAGTKAIRVSIEEAALLQSFPADHPWQGTKTKMFEQVGNAVPPLLARAVLEALCA